MIKKYVAATCLLAVMVAGCGGGSDETGQAAKGAKPINISYQPALYWSLPYYIATEKGWWGEMGLNPKFSTFPSGAPQMAAAAAGSWDVGGTGSAPAVLGAARFGIETVGITNDESAANVLMARAGDAQQFQDLSQAEGKRILLTTNSTGEYSVFSCLEKAGVDPSNVTVVNLGQGEIISAFSSGQGQLAGVWAPNSYTLQNKAKAKTVCTGKQAGAVVPGALVVRDEFAEQNPDLVAKYLAVYLHAQQWMRDNPDETIDMMKSFYREGGVIIPEESMKQEVQTRPTFNLQQQLDIMGGEGSGDPKAAEWFQGIVRYMRSTGTLNEQVKPKEFLTDKYLRMVQEDPKLKAFATSGKE